MKPSECLTLCAVLVCHQKMPVPSVAKNNHCLAGHFYFFFAGSCMAQQNSLSGRSPFCQLSAVKKIIEDDLGIQQALHVIKHQKLEETRDKPWARKKTASQRVSEATA